MQAPALLQGQESDLLQVRDLYVLGFCQFYLSCFMIHGIDLISTYSSPLSLLSLFSSLCPTLIYFLLITVPFLRNMLPELPIAISQPCNRFFHLEDFEFAYLSSKNCPYSRVKNVGEYGSV